MFYLFFYFQTWNFNWTLSYRLLTFTNNYEKICVSNVGVEFLRLKNSFGYSERRTSSRTCRNVTYNCFLVSTINLSKFIKKMETKHRIFCLSFNLLNQNQLSWRKLFISIFIVFFLNLGTFDFQLHSFVTF